MPRRPDFLRHRPDPRFDRYRGRVGRLFRDEEEVGLLLVEVEAYAEQAGGHLWWTRWDTSRDVLWLWTLVDGRSSDSLVPDDAADEELRQYDAGRYIHDDGEPLCVLWTDPAESQHLRAVEFGRHEPPG